MRHLAFAFGVLVLGWAAVTPARADWAVVRWPDGFCRLWWDSHDTPWGVGWTKIAIAPDWETAEAAFDAARRSGTCQ